MRTTNWERVILQLQWLSATLPFVMVAAMYAGLAIAIECCGG